VIVINIIILFLSILSAVYVLFRIMDVFDDVHHPDVWIISGCLTYVIWFIKWG